MLLMQNQRPAGKVQTKMCRSQKKETQVVGWCSDTDAMMGICIFAYLTTGKTNTFTEQEKKKEKEKKALCLNKRDFKDFHLVRTYDSTRMGSPVVVTTERVCSHHLPGVPQGVEAATPWSDVSCRWKRTKQSPWCSWKCRKLKHCQPVHTVWFWATVCLCVSLGVCENLHPQTHRYISEEGLSWCR